MRLTSREGLCLGGMARESEGNGEYRAKLRRDRNKTAATE